MLWCGVQRVSLTPHRGDGVVSPLATTATCRRTGLLVDPRAGTSFGYRKAVLSTLAAGFDRVGFLPRCLLPCIFIPTLSLLPAKPKPPTHPHIYTPTHYTHNTHANYKKTRRARGRLALGFIHFLYALSFEDAVYFPPCCSLIFPFGIGLRRLAFLVNQMFCGFPEPRFLHPSLLLPTDFLRVLASLEHSRLPRFDHSA